MQDQSRADFVRNRINILMKLGREEQVLKEYDEILKLSGDNDEIHFKKAVLLFRMKRMKEAAEECDRAIAANPNLPIYHYGKALALNVLEDYPASLREVNEVLRLVSSPSRGGQSEGGGKNNINREIERLLTHFEEIESHEVPEQTLEHLTEDVAVPTPERIMESFSPELKKNRVTAEEQSFLEADFAEAIDDVKKLDKALKDIDSHLNRLKNSQLSVDLAMDEKERKLKSVLRDNSDPQIAELIRRHSEVMRIDLMGEDARNLRKIDRVLEANPKNGELHYGKSLFLFMRGDFEEAVREMEIARNLDPVSSAYSYGLTLIENKEADYDASFRSITNLVNENPDNPSSHYKRGLILYLLKRFGEAADEFNNAIELYQYDPRYYYGRTISAFMLDSPGI